MNTEILSCHLNELEVAARADRAARAMRERDSLEREMKDAAKQAKLELAEKDVELRDLLKQVRDKAEWREVAVSEEPIAGRVMLRVRRDTGEEIGRRAMTEEEAQLGIFSVRAVPEPAEKVEA